MFEIDRRDSRLNDGAWNSDGCWSLRYMAIREREQMDS